VTIVDELIQTGLLGEALDKGPALVLVADEQMNYVAVNDLAAEILGYTRSELLGMKVSDLNRDPESGEHYEEMMREGRRMGICALTCRNGDEIDFHYRAARTRVAGLDLYVAVGFVR
jgi:PAS domain S-box-containing protein